MQDIEIAGRRIGPAHPTYIIAELSANHHQSFDKACELVRAAAATGADAIKLQTYTADTITIDCRNEHFQIKQGTLWDGKVLYDLYKEAYTPWPWQPKLMELAASLGVHCFSSPFDPTAVDFLESLEVPAYKLASFELVDVQLIEKMARTGKPIIMSTGMATLAEIAEAVDVARGAGATQLVLLRTNSGYPAKPSEMDLRSIQTLRETFGTVVGLSDHTHGIVVPVAAVSLGARVVEKHMTLSRDEPGPDSAFSLEPDEFKAMVDAVRVAEQALGGIRFGPSERERGSRTFRRSLFVVQDVEAGTVLTDAHVRSIRPSAGLHTRFLPVVRGRKAARPLAAGTPLDWTALVDAEPIPSSSQVDLRKATKDDIQRVYEWVNTPEVRRLSFSSRAIEWNEHVEWFTARVDDPASLYFIVEQDGRPVGQVRFDTSDGGDGVVSVVVDRSHRGRGLGIAAIESGTQRALAEGFCRRAIAYIKPVNVASVLAFAKAGYSGPCEVIHRDESALVMTRGGD